MASVHHLIRPLSSTNPGHGPGPEPRGSADRHRATGLALQLAGKGIGLFCRDEPLLAHALATPAQVLDGAGIVAAFAAAGFVEIGRAHV